VKFFPSIELTLNRRTPWLLAMVDEFHTTPRIPASGACTARRHETAKRSI
jgi:hypothetical protein